jgi:hypothetical protein
MSRRNLFAIALLALGAMALPLHAEEPATSDDWKVQVAPYVFGASMKGDAVVKGQPAKIDLSSSDILDHMDIGWMGMVSARKGSWGVGADFIWVDLSADTPVGKVEPTLGIASVVGLRRVASWAEVSFGARYTRVNAKIDFTVPAPLSVEKKRDWVDPTVGVILRTPQDHRWYAKLVADVGGFGVGSDLTWQAVPAVGVDLAKWVSLELGYRWLDTDYETGSGADRFEYDILLQGPIFGAAFKW